MARQPNLYALIVGIDQYPDPRHRLNGCVNDAKAVAAFLRARFGERAHLDERYDEAANRTGVIAGFQHFQQAKDGDICFLYYSGHGAQIAAPPAFLHLEPDGLLETIVCQDSRTRGGFDLADKELSVLIWQAQQGRDVEFVTVFDCCHSGSNTRDVGVRARRLEPDLTPRDLRSFYGTEYFGLRPEGEELANPFRSEHIHISAARSNETAKEKEINGTPRGVFTYNLLRLLETDASFTYRELVDNLRVAIANSVSQQTPQLSGPDERKLDTFLRLQPRGSKDYFSLNFNELTEIWTVNVGQVHGLTNSQTADTQLVALRPDGTEVPLHLGQVGVTSSEVELETVLTEGESYRVVVKEWPVTRVKVASVPDDEAEGIAAVKTAYASGEPSLYYEWTDNVAAADYHLRAMHGGLRLTLPGDDRPLFQRTNNYRPISVSRFLGQLESVAHYRYVQQLANPRSNISTEHLKIEWYRLTQPGSWNGPDGDAAPAELLDISEVQPFHYDYDQSSKEWLKPAYRLRLTNTSGQPLFVSAVALWSTYSISNQFLSNQELAPGESAWLEDQAENDPQAYRSIPIYIDEHLTEAGVNQVDELIKLFVSTEELTTDRYNQAALAMDTGIKTGTTRGGGRGGIKRSLGADWRTFDLRYSIVRPVNETQLSGGKTEWLGELVSITLPAGMSAMATLNNADEAQRSLDSSSRVPGQVPGWAPFALSEGRAGFRPLSVLELSRVEGADQIDSDNPLYLELPRSRSVDAADEVVIPVAVDPDSGWIYPLGLPDGDGRIRVDQLPESTPTAERSLGGSIKIFFVKQLNKYAGFSYDYPQLAKIDLAEVPGQTGQYALQYQKDTAAVKAAVATAQHIVIYTHGIIGDTMDMPKIMHLVRSSAGDELANKYDLALTFDYENLNTPIEETARLFKERLTALGLTEGHGKTVHLVAHSMGGLVSRWLIEREGGSAIINHLFMVGTPNGGSPYGSVYELMSALMATAVNKATFLTPYMIPVNFLGRVVDKMSVTLKQMKPKSDFYQTLNAGNDPGIPYTLIVGNTSLISPEVTEKYQSLLKRVLARFRQRGHYDLIQLALFRAANDIAVSVDSQTTLPGSEQWQHPPRSIPAACDHISYFAEPGGLAALQVALFGEDVPTVA